MSKSKGTGRGRRPIAQPPLRVIIEGRPDPDFDRLQAEAIDAFAEAMADRLIEEARAQVAAELGIDPSTLPPLPWQFPSIEDALDDPPPRRRR